jgi:DNA invertase Pin-like site-specific DNA recombinase
VKGAIFMPKIIEKTSKNGVITTFSDGLWEERHELQRQGIDTAKAQGRYLGRPKVGFPPNWEEYYSVWKEGGMTATEAMRRMGLKKDSFYRLVKKYENMENNSSK